VRRLYAGLGDPRSVWHAFAERVDSYRYDTGDRESSADTVTLDAVTGDAPAAEDVVTLRAEGRAALAAETSMDAAGNVTRAAKLGVVSNSGDTSRRSAVARQLASIEMLRGQGLEIELAAYDERLLGGARALALGIAITVL